MCRTAPRLYHCHTSSAVGCRELSLGWTEECTRVIAARSNFTVRTNVGGCRLEVQRPDLSMGRHREAILTRVADTGVAARAGYSASASRAQGNR